jgi:hypothetical protein
MTPPTIQRKRGSLSRDKGDYKTRALSVGTLALSTGCTRAEPAAVSSSGTVGLSSVAAHPSSSAPRSAEPLQCYESYEAWQKCVKTSEVRLQWDPDHDPYGGKLERRAIQLGLRGSVLERFAKEWIVAIEDISEHCRIQAGHVGSHHLEALMTPAECVYPAPSVAVKERLGLD